MPNAYCTKQIFYYNVKLKVKRSRYRPGVAQRVGRGIAALLHDRCTRRGWVVSSTPRPLFTPEKQPVPILQEAGWVPGSVWTDGGSRPHRDSIPDRPARSQSLYRLSYRTHFYYNVVDLNVRRVSQIKKKETVCSLQLILNMWPFWTILCRTCYLCAHIIRFS